MIEESGKKLLAVHKENRILEFPVLPNTNRQHSNLILSENTFKLCRVGAAKSKFINFDLKNPNDKIANRNQHSITIPMLKYKESRFGYLRKQTPKHEHSLLISRTKQSNAQPSFASYDTSNYQSIKYKQSYKVSFPNISKLRLLDNEL